MPRTRAPPLARSQKRRIRMLPLYPPPRPRICLSKTYIPAVPPMSSITIALYANDCGRCSDSANPDGGLRRELGEFAETSNRQSPLISYPKCFTNAAPLLRVCARYPASSADNFPIGGAPQTRLAFVYRDFYQRPRLTDDVAAPWTLPLPTLPPKQVAAQRVASASVRHIRHTRGGPSGTVTSWLRFALFGSLSPSAGLCRRAARTRAQSEGAYDCQ
ncbi:hypothetical protein C8R44DRAFT_212537 [Mycena epipterygia]|nr:hypothetical protein C8R44DRAFT_212537 [Mycena epipterygia]